MAASGHGMGSEEHSALLQIVSRGQIVRRSALYLGVLPGSAPHLLVLPCSHHSCAMAPPDSPPPRKGQLALCFCVWHWLIRKVTPLALLLFTERRFLCGLVR